MSADVQERSARESCGNCRYFAALASVCRKNPPAIFPAMEQDALGRTGLKFHGAFAPTLETWWCGAWADEATARRLAEVLDEATRPRRFQPGVETEW